VQPSSSLVSDARQLAADGARQSPATGLATYLKPVATTPQQAMTLAQSIAPAATSSSAAPMDKVSAMLNEARLLNGLPYAWGGGHTDPAWVVGSGYDCSGFVSEVLHSAGYLNSPDTTQTLPGSAGILNGPGKLVTIYDRTIATVKVWVKHKKIVTEKKIVNQASAGVHVDKGRHANSLNSVSIKLPKWVGEWQTIKVNKLVRSQDTSNNDEHVIIDIDGQWWESGGSTTDGGAAMVHQIVDPNAGYLKSFNRILHPAGL
jgi:cell wall-associated NlpC family hydrolase